MEILGKLARKRAASEAEDGSRPARVDPFASVMEELEWLPMDDDQAVKPTPARAAPVPERPVPGQRECSSPLGVAGANS